MMSYEVLAQRALHGTWSTNRIANIALKISVLDLSPELSTNRIANIAPKSSVLDLSAELSTNRIANIAPKISVLDLPAGRPRNGIGSVTPRISAIGACDCQFGKVEIPLIFFLNSQLFNYGLFCPQSPCGHTQKTRIKNTKISVGWSHASCCT
jgi:hypothetical protein